MYFLKGSKEAKYIVHLTEISIAEQDIGKKIATWRNQSGSKPFYRLWYTKLLLFEDKNLNLVTFYYDFITQEKYSECVEIYQYNHITNYSYVDEDISYMNEDPLIEKINLPLDLTRNIFGNEVKTISVSSSSGSYFRSVIPDKAVAKGLQR